MKNIIKKFNLLLALVTATVLITSNIFGAAVADNDGSAFITNKRTA